MREELRKKVTMYQATNDIALRGEIVVFGSTFMANFPFYELSQKYVMPNAVYNRSVEGLTLEEAEAHLDECVLDIKPSKIFLSLGETDLENPSALTVYNRILFRIKTKLPEAKIYVLSVPKDDAAQNDEERLAFNEKLKDLADRANVRFLGLEVHEFGKRFYEKIFKELHCFFRSNRLSFADAFSCGD
ncbi:MAG: hypothetical protein IJX91_02035 [Clostridia bacterium]|nr:hypothetical protein [Clostridia bacterium]